MRNVPTGSGGALDSFYRLLGFLAASSSIGILLAQFYGIASMRTLSWSVFLPACAVLVVLGLTPRRLAGEDFRRRLATGLWAGWWATVAYDLWRAPFFLLGMNPFRAHQCFGELLTGLSPDTAGSQVAGWLYHLSNGIAFGVMYAMAVRRPAVWSAILWGIILETGMLLTPYCRVLGIPLNGKFLAMSLTAHICYGAVLGWIGRRRSTTP